MPNLGSVVRYLGNHECRVGRIIYQSQYDGLSWYFVKEDGRMSADWVAEYRIYESSEKSDWLAYFISRWQWAIYETVRFTRLGCWLSAWRFRKISRKPLFTPLYEVLAGSRLLAGAATGRGK